MAFKLKSGGIRNLFTNIKSKLQKVDDTLQNLGKKKDITTTTTTTKPKLGIKEKMQRKYGTGEYSRKGELFEKRMKPGESKFNYDVRMRKEGYRAKQREPGILEREIADRSDLTTEERVALGEKLYPREPGDLRAPETTNFGVTDKMSFGEAFQQAKLGGIEPGGEFEWMGEPYKFEYEEKGAEEVAEIDTEDYSDIDMDGIDDRLQGTTKYHKKALDPELYPEYKHNKKKKEVIKKKEVVKKKPFDYSGRNYYGSK